MSEPSGVTLRDELTRAVRFNAYVRILFSVLLLAYAVFGPGLLLRFPATDNLMFEPLSQFYAFRPVIYALVFVALISVLAALSRRAAELFEVKARADMASGMPEEDRKGYFRHLHPSVFPFVLSGQALIDVLIFVVVLVAYSLWLLLLVELTPKGMSGYETAGVVLGSYGLFASLIIVVLAWLSSARRARALRSQLIAEPSSSAA